MNYDRLEDLALPPMDEARLQVGDALTDIDRPQADYLRLPWGELDRLVCGIAPGHLWYVGAYSGHGKTTFMMSFLNLLFQLGKVVYYMGLESRPNTLRTQWACQRLGLDSGMVLTGGLYERADADFLRQRLRQEVLSQKTGEIAERVYFCPRKFVDAEGIEKSANEAREIGADVFIVDHVDHLEGEGRGMFEQSVRANKALHQATLDFGLRTFAATQFNNEMVKGNRLGLHQPPSPTAVYMGNHKRQLATGMIGLYRPLKFSGVSLDEMKDFAKGALEPKDVCEPNTMACLIMKHRLFGSHEGRKAYLRVEHGIVVDMPETEMGALHGIRSARSL